MDVLTELKAMRAESVANQKEEERKHAEENKAKSDSQGGNIQMMENFLRELSTKISHFWDMTGRSMLYDKMFLLFDVNSYKWRYNPIYDFSLDDRLLEHDILRTYLGEFSEYNEDWIHKYSPQVINCIWEKNVWRKEELPNHLYVRSIYTEKYDHCFCIVIDFVELIKAKANEYFENIVLPKVLEYYKWQGCNPNIDAIQLKVDYSKDTAWTWQVVVRNEYVKLREDWNSPPCELIIHPEIGMSYWIAKTVEKREGIWKLDYEPGKSCTFKFFTT